MPDRPRAVTFVPFPLALALPLPVDPPIVPFTICLACCPNVVMTGFRSIESNTSPTIVPQLSVGKIELDIEEPQAGLNLTSQVVNLVTVNADVAVSVSKANITISEVDAELELILRLGHLVYIVNHTFTSLDLNPLLTNTPNNLTSIVGDAVGEVDGLLGSVT